jgi:hypothetical protein
MAKKVDCSELAEAITRIAFNLGSRPGINTIDAVVAEMQKNIPEIRRGSVIEAIDEATRRKPAVISDTAKQLRDLKLEVRNEKALQGRISILQQHLEAQTLPQGKVNNRIVPDAIKGLRDIRDGLNKLVKQSDPAKIKGYEKQINDMIQKLERVDYAMPAKKVDTLGSKAVEQKRFERDKLREEINRRINAMKPKSNLDHVISGSNIIKSIITSFDFSAVGIQNIAATLSHPIMTAKNIVPMLKAFGSEKVSQRINQSIYERPNAYLYHRTGLALTEYGPNVKLSKMEEAYMSQLTGKIPVVAGSNRAFVTFLNLMRADLFDLHVATLARKGEPTLEQAQVIANWVNVATGRGSLGGLEKYATGLNVLWSPKLQVSRIQLLLGQPLWGKMGGYAGTAAARKAIAKEYVRLLVGAGTVLALGVLAGADIEDDPRSTDFLKLKFGNTRVNVLGGLPQYLVLFAKLITGQTKSSTTGKITAIRGKDVPYRGDTCATVIGRFIRTKLSPTIGIPLDVITGENVVGEPVTLESTAKSIVIPLSLRDIADAADEQGVPVGSVMGLLSIFGFSIQTYEAKPTKSKTKTSVADFYPTTRSRQRPSRRAYND